MLEGRTGKMSRYIGVTYSNLHLLRDIAYIFTSRLVSEVGVVEPVNERFSSALFVCFLESSLRRTVSPPFEDMGV